MHSRRNGGGGVDGRGSRLASPSLPFRLAGCAAHAQAASRRAASVSARKNENVRRPVSRVLFRPEGRRRSFLWTAGRPTVLATYPDASGDEPCEQARATSLFGLAPGGACHAVPVARSAVGSYPTLSPFPSFAEAPEGEPFVALAEKGGLLSVALSLGSPRAGVTRRLFTVEPGLSSTETKQALAPPRPPGRLTGARWAFRATPSTSEAEP